MTKTRPIHLPHRASQGWLLALAMAASSGGDAGGGNAGEPLPVLARRAGLDAPPAMTIIVKRARPLPPPVSPDELQPTDAYAYLRDDFAGLLVAV